MAGGKGEFDGIEETRGAWLPPGGCGWGGRGLKRRGCRGGGFKGCERKGQAGALDLRLRYRRHREEIRPGFAADGRAADRRVLLLGGTEVHRGHVDEVRLGMETLVVRRRPRPAH